MSSLSELACTSCHQSFNLTTHIPRLLAECGHTFCTVCIGALLGEAKGFACPDDGVVCGANKRTPEEFPKNLSLLRIIERQSTNKENASSCTTHNKRLEIVCMDCKKHLCSKCALFEGHRAHELRPEEDVYSELALRKELLQDMLQMVNDNHQLILHKSKLEEVYEKCEMREEELRGKVEERFGMCVKMLNDKKSQVLQMLNIVSQSIKERIRELQGHSKDLPDMVEGWKEEAGKKLRASDWNEVLSLLEDKDEAAKDFFHAGEEILEELARVKANLSSFCMEELIGGWSITFDMDLERRIGEYCTIKNPFDIDGTPPIIEFEENNEEIFPIRLEDGNLLNESGSFYENCCLANLSPSKRLSLTKSIAEGRERNSARFSLANSVAS
eukprot:TRINITY_DN2677_c0_g1_i2.p1 TRINITY_DN2677_c0_g1~~TRINITY_DN2677_c0_g1_i2.p1  ORF type:complete len:386 (-),score=111.02 TRINITY_DN2677_c0_g1_i2:181-1338(-)